MFYIRKLINSCLIVAESEPWRHLLVLIVTITPFNNKIRENLSNTYIKLENLSLELCDMF